jgi:hypothetical protein
LFFSLRNATQVPQFIPHGAIRDLSNVTEVFINSQEFVSDEKLTGYFKILLHIRKYQENSFMCRNSMPYNGPAV